MGTSKFMERNWVERSLRASGLCLLTCSSGTGSLRWGGQWPSRPGCALSGPGWHLAGWPGLWELLPPRLLLSSELWALGPPFPWVATVVAEALSWGGGAPRHGPHGLGRSVERRPLWPGHVVAMPRLPSWTESLG